MRARRRAAGFTLLELLVASSLVSVVTLGFMAVYGTSQTYLTETLNSSGLNGNAAYIMEQITSHLRAASTVNLAAGTPSNTVTITLPGAPPEVIYKVEIDTSGQAVLYFDPDGSGTQVRTPLTENLVAVDKLDDRVSPPIQGSDGIPDGLVFKRGGAAGNPASSVTVILRMKQGTAALELTSTTQMRASHD